MQRRTRILASAAAFAALLSGCSRAYADGSDTIEKANGYVNAHEWDGLLHHSIEWPRVEPDAPMAWFYLGTTYGQPLKQPGRPLPAFERAVALRPEWPEAWNALGFVNVELKRYDEAVKAFTHAVEQAKTRANCRNRLAAAYAYQNRLSLAVETLQDEQRATSGSSVFVDWYNLVKRFCAMQEPTLASAAYRRAIRISLDYGPAWSNLGAIEGLAGNMQGALNDYQRASALGDELGATNYSRLQQAMAAARQRSSDDLLHQLWRAQAADLQWRAQQAWQDRPGRAQS